MADADKQAVENEEQKEKKPRQRKKKLCKQIRNQMEFYFSDANLSKDGFVKQLIDADSDGYVPLDTFLNFNKIRALTSDLSLLAKALSNSPHLKVSEDGLKVKRATPYKEPKDVDERTIYVECLPVSVDHDWVRETFAEYGHIVYISLPRYKTTGDFKGFAFIEYQTVEAAQKACQALYDPDETIMGRFPKSNKQMKQIQKQQAMQESEKVEKQPGEQEQEKVVTPTKKGKRRRRNTSESSGDEAYKSDSEKNNPCPKKNAKRKLDGDLNTEEEIKNNSKRKINDKGETSITKRHKGSDSSQNSDKENVESDIRTSSDKETKAKDATKSINKDSKSKACSKSSSDKDSKAAPSVSFESDQKKDGDEGDNDSALSRKRSHDSDTESKEIKRVRISEEVQVKVGSPLHKKRHRKRSKKEPVKDKPALRVIPKLRWLQLRNEYLSVQKQNMTELKKNLEVNRKAKAQLENKKEKSKPKVLEFVPDVIVKVTSDNSATRKGIMEMAGLVSEVAYVDMLDGDSEAHIRCASAAAAARLAAADQAGLKYTLIKGDEEKTYWDKIIADRERKLNSKSRNRKRGAQKLLDRVEKSNMDTMQKKHVYFDD